MTSLLSLCTNVLPKGIPGKPQCVRRFLTSFSASSQYAKKFSDNMLTKQQTEEKKKRKRRDYSTKNNNKKFRTTNK
jgi:hypothetical protein